MSNNSNIKIIKLLSIVIILLILILVLSTMKLKEINDKIAVIKNENVVLVNENTQLEDKNKELLQYEELVKALEAVNVNSEFRYYSDVPLDIRLQEFIQIKAEQAGFGESFIYSIIQTESGYDKNIVSYNGTSVGLMQINKNSADYLAKLAGLKEYNLNNPYDSVVLGITNLAFSREYWKQRGITSQEELFYYITTSYNRGISGLTDYIKVNKTPVSRYSMKILRSKSDIEQNNNN